MVPTLHQHMMRKFTCAQFAIRLTIFLCEFIYFLVVLILHFHLLGVTYHFHPNYGI